MLAKTLLKAHTIELNPQFEKALDLIEKTNQNLFLTGRAGTGKSTLLNYFRNQTKKKIVVLAPTGVAALNVKGQTIHSFFRFKPSITLKAVKKEHSKEAQNLYKKIDTIVIDEISMVRSDLLDCIDKSLRLNRGNSKPFGGVQMIFIGDLYQLPPVVTNSEKEIFETLYNSQYFFDAKVLLEMELEFIELEKVYRQKDDSFISLLNAVRNNTATEEHLSQINQRYNPSININPKSLTIYLTTTNDLANQINYEQLEKLSNKLKKFRGFTTGSFDLKSLPTDIELSVKVGSQIMMLNNDRAGRWVNGTIGKIIGFKKDEDEEDLIIVELSNGQIEEVENYTWEMFHFSYSQKENSLISEIVGTFTQYPLKLAWAVTIHKSQGKTFDNVIIDLGRGTFAHGQLYVALSRCTSLEGIILKQLIQKRHIFMDYRVVKFITKFQYQKAEDLLPFEEKIKILETAVKNKQKLNITYLKASDEKSERFIKPLRIGEMEYHDKTFFGLEAFDEDKQSARVFRIDRILEIT